MSNLLRILLVLCAPVLLGSCATSAYRSAWAQYEVDDEPIGLAGRWEGTWKSDWNGHEGKLRCLMTPIEEPEGGEGGYSAWFHSTFAVVLSFQYETVFTVVDASSGLLRFQGQEDLGSVAGGVYRYDGTVEGDRFHATYTAENGDHGVFEMRRQR